MRWPPFFQAAHELVLKAILFIKCLITWNRSPSSPLAFLFTHNPQAEEVLPRIYSKCSFSYFIKLQKYYLLHLQPEINLVVIIKFKGKLNTSSLPPFLTIYCLLKNSHISSLDQSYLHSQPNFQKTEVS